MRYTTYNKTFAEFKKEMGTEYGNLTVGLFFEYEEVVLEKQGSNWVETDQVKLERILVGDVNSSGGCCNCCESWPDENTIVTRYAHVL